MSEPHFSKSADRNKEIILEQLRKRCAPGAELLEIASGTAQHALHCSLHMPDIFWQPSDTDLNAYGLADIVAGSSLQNLLPPLILDVTRFPKWDNAYDAVYSANCIHVMPSRSLKHYVAGAAAALKPGGMMMLYGPFKYGGEFTTQSNAEFDSFLRGTYEDGGIRDFERVDELAQTHGLKFHSDTDLPANNQFIIWQKRLTAA